MAVSKFMGVTLGSGAKVLGRTNPSKIFGITVASGGGHSAPVFRAAASAQILTNTATIDKPTGTVADDYMVAVISVDGGARTITPPAGWTQLALVQKTTGDQQTMGVYGKRAGGSEGANYAFTVSGGAGGGAIVGYSGVDTTTAIDVTASTAESTGGTSPVTVAASSVTTVTANAMVLWIAATDQGANNPISAGFTPPTGFTERVDNSSYDWTTFTVAEKGFASAGATGSVSGTFSASSGSHGYIAALVALRPV